MKRARSKNLSKIKGITITLIQVWNITTIPSYFKMVI